MSNNNRNASKADAIIGQRLRIARNEVQMSQAELGATLGVSFQQIQKYEKGVNRISARDLTKLAKVLQQPVEHFLGEIDAKPSSAQLLRRKFLASREGAQIIDAAMHLPPYVQQAIITLARNLNKEK